MSTISLNLSIMTLAMLLRDSYVSWLDHEIKKRSIPVRSELAILATWLVIYIAVIMVAMLMTAMGIQTFR